MLEYSDGTKVEIDEKKLSIRVYNEPENGNFEISGFEFLSDIKNFLNFADFTEGKNNEFYTIAGKKATLYWMTHV